jgi:TonB family protein
MAVSGRTLPDLPAVSIPAASLAPRNSVLVPAMLVQGRTPQYPEAAKRMGPVGMVKLHISISADGKVTDVRALSGDPFLRQASIAAVREWVYRPAYLDGKPVPSTAEVSLRFTPSR